MKREEFSRFVWLFGVKHKTVCPSVNFLYFQLFMHQCKIKFLAHLSWRLVVLLYIVYMYCKVWKSSENGLYTCNVYFSLSLWRTLKFHCRSRCRPVRYCCMLEGASEKGLDWIVYIIDWNYPFLILLINSNLNISKTESQENLDTT